MPRFNPFPQLLRQRASMHGDQSSRLREKEYGIWNPYSWNHYYQTARAVATWPAFARPQAGRPRRHRRREHAGMVYADLGVQMIGAVGR